VTAAPTVTPAPTPVPTPEPTPFVEPSVPELDLDFGPHKLGETVLFSNDDDSEVISVDVLKVRKWTSTNMFIDPAKGNRFVTVEVLLKGVTGTTEDVGYLDFGIADEDGYTYDPEAAWRDPQLPYAGDVKIKPGKKVRGWVTFEVPKTLKKGTITVLDEEWAFHL